ncbi:ABC transporter substrate-binding protein [Janibacter alkaliphilus]|uniref:Polar amino acid transport system substrate-binding protein n=1 Tax=Janibacter alkaliphilus TaxID=1069963 RepID=A0A852XE38_9MICO|nr:polar amino acid transport system substrate-binding protein [Janibacter alkaliphilus]
MRATRSTLALLSLGGLLAAGCTAPAEESETSSSASQDCSKESLETLEEGTLTVATDDPAYEPWFVDNEPSNGEGYESAVAFAIAEELGFAEDEVTWTTATFNTVVAPGDKDFDLDLNQVSISDERKQSVDFSSGYYDVRQTVVTTEGSPLADVTSVDELAESTLGAQVGTTSYTAITDTIQPGPDPSTYDTNDQAVQALKNGQIDGIVVDLPTAYYMTAAQLDDGVIVGQLPAEEQPEQFGAVLAKDSPLTGCVTQAVDALREDGTLEELQQEWLTEQGAPELS